MKTAGRLASLAAVAATTGCSEPRAHAAVRITPDGARVVPSLSTSIAGLGVSVSE